MNKSERRVINPTSRLFGSVSHPAGSIADMQKFIWQENFFDDGNEDEDLDSPTFQSKNQFQDEKIKWCSLIVF